MDTEELKNELSEHNAEHKELSENRLKRQAVVAKHKDMLDASIIGKQKGIRFRRYFHKFVNHIANAKFESEEKEYRCIGKAGREYWTDYDEHLKAYGKKDPMLKVIRDIMTEFGCFNY